LGAVWRAQGDYMGAEEAVRSALMQEHFAAAQKGLAWHSSDDDT
jgi:DNA helicase-2/ATP-dependent DNA helicase PcrA